MNEDPRFLLKTSYINPTTKAFSCQKYSTTNQLKTIFHVIIIFPSRGDSFFESLHYRRLPCCILPPGASVASALSKKSLLAIILRQETTVGYSAVRSLAMKRSLSTESPPLRSNHSVHSSKTATPYGRASPDIYPSTLHVGKAGRQVACLPPAQMRLCSYTIRLRLPPLFVWRVRRALSGLRRRQPSVSVLPLEARGGFNLFALVRAGGSNSRRQPPYPRRLRPAAWRPAAVFAET